MIRLGYANEDFITLEESFENGSREALIAIGWLLYTYQLIDALILSSNGFVEEEYFKSKVEFI
jgi:hypothetical protein